MPVEHRLMGFDKQTERMACDYLVPDVAVLEARRIAEADPDWCQEPGSLPLTSDMAAAIGGLLKLPLDGAEFDWFLEPVAV